MKTTYVNRNTRTFQEAVKDALVTHEDDLVQLSILAKVELATAGKAMGVYQGKLQTGMPDVTVRMLGKDGTVVVRQNAAIVPGALVMQDPAAPTRVITLAGTGTAIGRKLSPAVNGAQGDKIEILDCFPRGTGDGGAAVVLTEVDAATTAPATITALVISAAYAQAEVTALRDEVAKVATDLAELRAKLVTAGVLTQGV